MEVSVQKYKALLKTVECGSFTKAAQILQYSQSGISRMIGDLEREWGVRLLERSRTGVLLTSDGMQILPYAKRVCAEYDRLRMQVDALHGIQTGTIRIGTFSSVATHWLPNMIGAFQKDYPNIDFDILMGTYPEIEQWVMQGRADCGFLHLPTRADLKTVCLAQDELMAVLPEDHPLAALEKIPASALAEQPFILLDKAGERDKDVMQVFERAGIMPKVRFTTLDDYAVMSMVEHGLGVSILPKLILRRIPYRVALRPLEQPVFRQIGLATRPGEELSPAAKRFLSYLPYRDGDTLSEK